MYKILSTQMGEIPVKIQDALLGFFWHQGRLESIRCSSHPAQIKIMCARFYSWTGN